MKKCVERIAFCLLINGLHVYLNLFKCLPDLWHLFHWLPNSIFTVPSEPFVLFKLVFTERASSVLLPCSNNKLKRLTVQMLQPTRSRNMALTYIPSYFSISSFFSCTVFSTFVHPAAKSLLDLGKSLPMQHFCWLSLGSGSKILSYLFTQLAHTNVSAFNRIQFMLIIKELPYRWTRGSNKHAVQLLNSALFCNAF